MTLEFSQNDEASVNLSEMRFHIPVSADPEAADIDPAEAFKGPYHNQWIYILIHKNMYVIIISEKDKITKMAIFCRGV